MRRILLTGGSGFVGRHIHRHLHQQGHAVRLVLRPGGRDRLAAPVAPTDIVETDDVFARDAAWWSRTCEGIDTVIHAAWYVEPGRYLDSPLQAACVAGTFALAQGAAEAGVGHFIGIGTCMEYRLPSDRLAIDAPLEPATLYAACKLSTYHMLREWFAQGDTVFSWCRIFYLFGEGEHAARLVPYLRQQLQAGQVARLSAGTQLRDFLDVDEAGAMIAGVVGTRQPGAINICSGQGTTIRAFAERIADEYGRRDLLEFGAARLHPSDPSAVVGICNAVRRAGSLPETSVEGPAEAPNQPS